MAPDGRPPAGRAVAWLAFVGTLAALAYGLRLVDSKPPEDVLYTYSVVFASAVQFGLMMGFVLLIGKGLPTRDLLGLRAPVTSAWRTVGLSAATLFGIFVASAALETFLDAGEEQGLTPDGWDPDRAVQYGFSFVAVAIMAPIVEELTYRGEGFFLLGRWGRGAAIVGTAVAFGLGHGLIEGLPILIIFGLGLAWLRAETESVYPCIVLHALFNATALIAAVTIES